MPSAAASSAAPAGAASTSTTFSAIAFPSLGNAQVERDLAAARSRGYAAGFAEGRRAAEAQLVEHRAELDLDRAAEARDVAARVTAAIDTLALATSALHARSAPVLAEAEGTLLSASAELAEAVIGHELSDVAGSARAALARATGTPEADAIVAVRMHPDAIATLDAAAIESVGASAGIRLVADPALGRGDAVAELPVGIIDARIASALARATAELLGGGE